MERHETEEHDVEVEPNPEPAREPFDPHMIPLEDDDDAKYLQDDDPRRIEVERRRGRAFTE
jgi:hypothetical protein